MHVNLGKRGDTIVEVLVVLAVLGLAIGTSFAIANHSLKDARDAQEHSEAVELVQQQIEDLRLLSSNSAIYTQPGNFCITDPSVPTFAASNPSSSTDPCLENTLYHIAISYTPVSNTFTVSSVWDSVFGTGTNDNNVTVDYKLYQ